MDPGGESLGEFEKLEVVEQREGLERSVGAKPAGAGAEAVGGIEDGDGGVRGGAPMVGIERTAETGGAGAGDPGALDST